eukprot:TRINITY_DN13266_c0_g1_i1.p1 TRINITY_DN13266_c0_g1~~TRINITY_DN13266_c0_g1_i1.p1  ORF type:complete len:458 (+),score=58.76 TRINITY_DN13266_c0_g1_i1:74-1447(+)
MAESASLAVPSASDSLTPPRQPAVGHAVLRQRLERELAAASSAVRVLRCQATMTARANATTWVSLQRSRKFRERLEQRALVVKHTKTWAQPNFVGLLRAQEELTHLACSPDDPTAYRVGMRRPTLRRPQSAGHPSGRHSASLTSTPPSGSRDTCGPSTGSRSMAPTSLTPTSSAAYSGSGALQTRSRAPPLFFRNTRPSPLLALEALRDRRCLPPARSEERSAAVCELLHSGLSASVSSAGGSGVSAAAIAAACAAEDRPLPPALRDRVGAAHQPREAPVSDAAIIRRLYQEDIDMRAERRSRLEDRVYARAAPQAHDSETQAAMVSRLAEEDVEARRAKLEELSEQGPPVLLPPPPMLGRTAAGAGDGDDEDEAEEEMMPPGCGAWRKFDSERIDAIVRRLTVEAANKRRDEQQLQERRLMERFLSQRVPSPKLEATSAAALFNRLYRGERRKPAA